MDKGLVYLTGSGNFVEYIFPKDNNEDRMNQIVMPYEDGKWAVVLEGDDSAPANIYETREEAIEAAKEIAMAKDNGLIILRRDGTIENTDGIGIDPFPSEDNSPEYNDSGDEGV
jgi:hypothetical protein